MGSISIETLRRQYSGKSDTEIAAQVAEENGYIVVLRYKSRSAPDYTDFATCMVAEEVKGYFNSPYCHDVEILYNIRSRALEITPTLLLQSKCRLCSRSATQQSLIIGGGNDFYFCPICATMFCQGCSLHLPLTGYPYGYAKCPYCDVQLQRAFPGAIGNKPLCDRGKDTREMTTEQRKTYAFVHMCKSVEEANAFYSTVTAKYGHLIEGEVRIVKAKDGTILNFGTKEITTKEYEGIMTELGNPHRLELRNEESTQGPAKKKWWQF